MVDWDKDHVDLKWEKPLKDGGAPITGYIIEKREKGSPKWVKACEVRISYFPLHLTKMYRQDVLLDIWIEVIRFFTYTSFMRTLMRT